MPGKDQFGGLVLDLDCSKSFGYKGLLLVSRLEGEIFTFV